MDIVLILLVVNLLYFVYKYLYLKYSTINLDNSKIEELQISKPNEVNEIKEKIEIKEVVNNKPKQADIKEDVNDKFKHNPDYLIPDEEYTDASDLGIGDISYDLLNPCMAEDDENEDTIVLDPNTTVIENNIIYLIDKDANRADKIMMNNNKITIGRLKNDVDYHIDLKPISRKHAYMYKKENKFYLKDLGSKNKTYINGYELEAEKFYELNNNDEITFGSKVFIFKTEMN